MTQTITFSRERTLIIPALSGRAIGWTRRHHGAGDRMLHSAAGREVKRLPAGGNRWGEAGALLLHWTEERGELVEIILAPFLIRMMVTFRAFKTRAQEKLAEHRGEFGRLAAVAVNHGRALAMV